MSIYITKNFKYSEFACPCCGKDRPINSHLVSLLQDLRDRIGRPILISKGGGLRCRSYNKKIYGYMYSPHLRGLAADVSVAGMGLIELLEIAVDTGFTRVGIYPDNHFLHLDVLRPVPSRVWVKFKKRKPKYFKTWEEAIEFAKRPVK